ncbi:MAG: Gldg family protein [Clostridia bacterium]|nr:Gldg family protein [Clostridia bacterium]
MNHENGWRKKLRHGSVSFAVTAAVLIAVLLLNIGATVLCSGKLWRIDLTPDSPYSVDGEKTYTTIYTLMDETKSLLNHIFEDANQKRPENDPVKVEIIFCAEPDLLMQNDMTRYPYYTALLLQKEYPDSITVSYRDVWSNPSSVDEFRSTKYSNIYQSDIIVKSGSEYRVNTVRSYYTYDTDASSSEPRAYNGQKQFVKHILDVTGAERPICCLTVNHGEPFAELSLEERESWTEYQQFMKVIEGSGYEIRFLDLETEEIPENCRLIITYDPTKDFKWDEKDVLDDDDDFIETRKLDAFLEKKYAYMVFVDADTPRLPNLEGFLEKWGIELMRGEGLDADGNTVTGAYHVTNPSYSILGAGESFRAQYAPGKSLGNAILQDILNSAAETQIYFENAIGIRYADNFTETYIGADEVEGVEAYSFGYREGNGFSRSIYDMFHAGTTRTPAQYTLQANGEVLRNADGEIISGSDVFRIMTISRERVFAEETNGLAVAQNAYVCAVGSTAFVKDSVLNAPESGSPYCNADVLQATLRYIGQEVNPVGLSFVYLYTGEIGAEFVKETDSQTQTQTVKSSVITTTVVLALIPAVLMAGAATVVLVRRRTRH